MIETEAQLRRWRHMNVVPFLAGGPSDVLARTLGHKMSQDWGHAVVVDNRAGASGIIGADIVAKSAPDGYTLIMAQVGDTISMSLYPKLPYNFERDFAPITLVGQTPFILVAHPSLRWAKVVRESGAKPD